MRYPVNRSQQAKEAVNTISKAEDILKKKGWIKGAFSSKNGVCLLQAITEANGPGQPEAQRIIVTLTGAATIPQYNDRESTTKEDVFTVLAAAKNIAKELAE